MNSTRFFEIFAPEDEACIRQLGHMVFLSVRPTLIFSSYFIFIILICSNFFESLIGQ
jgi:hypothetical protein